MGQLPDIAQMLFFQSNGLNRDGLTGLDHIFQFFLCADGNTAAMVDDGDAGTDLLYFFHIMGGVNDRGALAIQFLDTFQNFITALWVNGYGRFVQNDQLWLVRNATGNI